MIRILKGFSDPYIVVLKSNYSSLESPNLDNLYVLYPCSDSFPFSENIEVQYVPSFIDQLNN